jgi:hypothetical protein
MREPKDEWEMREFEADINSVALDAAEVLNSAPDGTDHWNKFSALVAEYRKDPPGRNII